jgi:hypothetical protein
MSTLEREVIEKFRQLDEDARKRVRALIEREADAQTAGFDFDAWWARVEAARITLRPDASGRTPTASDLVNEVREERDADILRSLGFRDSAGDSTD